MDLKKLILFLKVNIIPCGILTANQTTRTSAYEVFQRVKKQVSREEAPNVRKCVHFSLLLCSITNQRSFTTIILFPDFFKIYYSSY